MKHRRFLVALAVVVPLAAFIAAKVVASWRPVVLGNVSQRGAHSAHLMGDSERYVWVENYHSEGDVGYSKRTLFDLETGNARLLADSEGIADDGAWLWELQTDQEKPLLWLREGDEPPVSYALNADALHTTRRDVALFRVFPALNRVEMLLGRRIYRWNKSSRQLERTSKIAFSNGNDTALSRDGETIVHADVKSINLGVARTGQLSRRVPFRGFKWSYEKRVSPFGSWILSDVNDSKWPVTHWRVVNASTGRSSWNFYQKDWAENPVFSPDEIAIALPVFARKLWEIRDLQTGALARTLPMITGAQRGVFSPDGETLYSVANGVLYRQRAR